MELVTLRILYGFIRTHVGALTWLELLFGVENDLIDPAAIPEFTDDGITNEAGSGVVREVASLAPDDAWRRLKELAGVELAISEVREAARDKWLYLALAWIFEHRQEYHDPLGMAERIFAEFDYPQRMSSFVRYMPSKEPDLGSAELNEARLFRNWQEFLREESAKFS